MFASVITVMAKPQKKNEIDLRYEALPRHVNLPVGLSGNVKIVEVSSVITGICASQQEFSTRLSRWVPGKQYPNHHINSISVH